MKVFLVASGTLLCFLAVIISGFPNRQTVRIMLLLAGAVLIAGALLNLDLDSDRWLVFSCLVLPSVPGVAAYWSGKRQTHANDSCAHEGPGDVRPRAR